MLGGNAVCAKRVEAGMKLLAIVVPGDDRWEQEGEREGTGISDMPLSLNAQTSLWERPTFYPIDLPRHEVMKTQKGLGTCQSLQIKYLCSRIWSLESTFCCSCLKYYYFCLICNSLFNHRALRLLVLQKLLYLNKLQIYEQYP